MLTTQPITIETGGPDEDGCLVLANGRLVAALIRLSDGHAEMAGRWYLEHGFGPLDGPTHPTFSDLDSAQGWIARRLRERGRRWSGPRN
jgi:hypothetical protein